MFIGPPASAIDAMGSKTDARELMQKAGVPIVPGTTEPVRDRRGRAQDHRKDAIGYPVAVKAAGGGGGKGFRVALTDDELEDAFEGAAREGEKFFGDATVYLERYLPDPRHVEVQVLADGHGNVIHLGERDCSIQRRHQKLIEESPGARASTRSCASRSARSPSTPPRPSTTSARARSRACCQDDEYFFLEMNTRVQVEHCVTEMITGIDIVKEGIRAAAGEELSITQDDVELRGHAIECRINAEDASKNFAPAPGTIGAYRRAHRPRRARRLGRRRRRRDLPDVRPDGRQAHRLGRRPRAGHAADAARAGRVRDRELKTLIPFHKALLATDAVGQGARPAAT